MHGRPTPKFTASWCGVLGKYSKFASAGEKAGLRQSFGNDSDNGGPDFAETVQAVIL